MKYCEEYAALLDAFVDGELSAAEADRVRTHLTACDCCRSYVDAALSIRAAFPQVEDAIVPDGFAEGIMAAIRIDSRKHKKTAPWVKILLPMAACLAVVVALQSFPGMISSSAAPADSAGAYAERSDSNENLTNIADSESDDAKKEDTVAFNQDAVPPPETPLSSDNSAGFKAPAPNNELVPPAAPSAPQQNTPQNTPPVVMATRAVIPSLVVTSEEAGTLLADFVGYAYQDGTLSGTLYELSAEEYAALLTALPETVTAPPAPDTVPVLVLVTP